MAGLAPYATILVGEEEINWSNTTGGNNAPDIPIVDSGGYFTGTDVEAALQELGAAGGGAVDKLISVLSSTELELTDDATDQLLSGDTGRLRITGFTHTDLGDNLTTLPTLKAIFKGGVFHKNDSQSSVMTWAVGTYNATNPTNSLLAYTQGQNAITDTGHGIPLHLLKIGSSGSLLDNLGTIMNAGHIAADGTGTTISCTLLTNDSTNGLGIMHLYGSALTGGAVVTLTNNATVPGITVTDATQVCTNLNADKVDGYDLNQAITSGSAPTFTADNFSDGGGNAIITTTQETNFESAYSHISSNGSSHSYINQNVTVSGNPTFNALTVGSAGGQLAVNSINAGYACTITNDVPFAGAKGLRVNVLDTPNTSDYIVLFEENGTDRFFIDGDGIINFGTHSAIGAETITGYITMKDAGGTSRKIAVVS
jgi:hypothetical protein